jgi:hypothetical protein
MNLFFNILLGKMYSRLLLRFNCFVCNISILMRPFLKFPFSINYKGCFKQGLHNGISNVTVWQVLRKRLYAFKHKRFLNTRHTVTLRIQLYSSF